MQEIVALSVGVTLFHIPLVVVVWWGLLRLLDIVGGQKFTGLWHVLKSDPKALALYLCGRAVAVALLVGAVLH